MLIESLQTKQILRLTNAARTLNEMSTHASMYIPMSIPARLPQYIQLDHDSQWQISALLSAALETMTLPSRLKPGDSKRGFLSDMEAALNVNGNQRIAQLQFGVLEPDTEPAIKAQIRGVGDHRAPSSTNRSMLEEDDSKDTNADLDTDLFGGDFVSSNMNGHHVSDHTFGAVDCLRGRSVEQKTEQDQMDEEDDIGYTRKRARFAGKPISEK